MPLARQHGMGRRWSATLAWIHHARGDVVAAQAALGEAKQAEPSDEIVALFNPAPAERARLLLALGAVDDVAAWTAACGLSEEDVPSYPRERDYLVLARLLLARGAPERALPVLERIQTAAAAQGRVSSVIEARALALLSAGKTNREIADHLVVTLDTVRKHLSHVFSKLGVTNRTQAVAHSRSLGLLS